MRRRDFIRVAVGLAAAFPFAARAQQVDRIRRIGVLKGLPAVEFLHPRNTVSVLTDLPFGVCRVSRISP